MRLLERILVFVSLLSPVATLAQETASDLPRTLPDDINEVPIPRDTDRDFFTRLGNVREQFVDSGYAVSGALVWDVSPNLRGGIDTQRAVSRYLLGIGFAADLEKVLGWRGATVFVDFQHHDGTLGEAIVGDFQVFSNIDAPRRTQIPRAWLETHWLSDRLRIKAGKIDANNEFAYTLSGGSFLNSSMGFSPTIFVMPTYPDPAGGMVAEWTWSPRWQLRGGVFDGVGVTGVLTGERFPTTLFDDLDDLFTIFELDRSWGNQADGTLGRIGIGGWYHNGELDRFDGSMQSGTSGWFVTADQWLLNEGDCDEHQSQGLAAFIQIGGADDRVSPAATHWGGGLVWTGALPSRDEDVMGIGVTAVEFSDRPAAGFTAAREVATELFYQMMLPRNWNATVDVQAITNPGGVAARSTAVVTTARIIREF